jgi:hypothetical protein
MIWAFDNSKAQIITPIHHSQVETIIDTASPPKLLPSGQKISYSPLPLLPSYLSIGILTAEKKSYNTTLMAS